MPIVTAEREAADTQGSVALFFHEKKDEHSAPSAKVFGVSSCHVFRKHTPVDAYLCDDHGVDSIELAIYNYDEQSGSFSDNGDSGSLIFDSEGRMQLMVKYPHADFNRVAF
ncbi:hypothetical protein K488DRAFT_86474 [Vararia minispora EC-137]|uniref:Uncharacterized protein n=1 Tax=Vararia minispora EC-137 TaxID=1314806 RepID=A0ACB8QJJ0_9AGAM|nr:hypothetical protein K488DRAFT_86474 [Vararia minispora EC-137]